MIIADQPWLGWFWVRPIWEAIFSAIANYFTKAAENGATFLVIDVQISHEQTTLSMAMQNLIMAERSGNPDAIQHALHAYADAHSALVHDDGSATAQ